MKLRHTELIMKILKAVSSGDVTDPKEVQEAVKATERELEIHRVRTWRYRHPQ